MAKKENAPEWLNNVPTVITLEGEPPAHMRLPRKGDGPMVHRFLTENQFLADTHPWVRDITPERAAEVVDLGVESGTKGRRLDYYIFDGVEHDNPDALVGSVGLHGIGREGRIAAAGIYIGSRYHRSGFARRSVQALFDVATEVVGLEVIGCQIEDTNVASQQLALAIGAVPTERVQSLDVGDGPRDFRIWGYWPERGEAK